MATLDAELIVPPAPLEASQVAKPAELANEPVTTATARVAIEQRVGIVRRSVR